MKNLKEIILPAELSARLAEVYDAIQSEYELVSGKIGLTCSSCADNCCDSYFLHYTYTEWAYLWEGIHAMDEDARSRLIGRAKQYNEESRRAIVSGKLPQLMCPLNDDGLCTLYTHRLMICRLHGIPAAMTRPDGKKLNFPGCFRCQEIVGASREQAEDTPVMDRTPLLRKVAAIESELLGGRRHLFPKVKRTIAEMIAEGPPRVDKPFCER
jgi:Fe-S-cluster containining protein